MCCHRQCCGCAKVLRQKNLSVKSVKILRESFGEQSELSIYVIKMKLQLQPTLQLRQACRSEGLEKVKWSEGFHLESRCWIVVQVTRSWFWNSRYSYRNNWSLNQIIILFSRLVNLKWDHWYFQDETNSYEYKSYTRYENPV